MTKEQQVCRNAPEDVYINGRRYTLADDIVIYKGGRMNGETELFAHRLLVGQTIITRAIVGLTKTIDVLYRVTKKRDGGMKIAVPIKKT